MTYLAAGIAATGAFLVAVGRRRRLGDGIGRYLRPVVPETPRAGATATQLRLWRAGLSWSASEYRLRRLAAAFAGLLTGLLIAQGDLVVADRPGAMVALALAGAAAGTVGVGAWVTSRCDRRGRRLQEELPTVADALALGVLAGDSIAGAMESFEESARGVAASELSRALAAYHDGAGLPEALIRLGGETVHSGATRLYTVLANAHGTGGRLAETLADLAADYRATLARDLTAEGGRRALSTYGPILALMVPVALLFLMYPTLVGLRQLSTVST